MLQSLETEIGTDEQEISDLAAHYIDCVGGADDMFQEFMEFTQNGGEPGGPASGGSAFWQQVIRTRPFRDGEVRPIEVTPAG